MNKAISSDITCIELIIWNEIPTKIRHELAEMGVLRVQLGVDGLYFTLMRELTNE